MWNYLFLVLLFLFYAINFVSIYKFFRHHQWSCAIFLLLGTLLTFILTLGFFFTRNAAIENEITHLLSLLERGNFSALLVLFLNMALLITGVISYSKVVTLEKKERSNRRHQD